jgi:ASC-1-like (ASCH) protein
MEPNCYYEHLSEPWFSLILLGIKKVEGRKNKGRFKEMKIGDIIQFYNDDYKLRTFSVKITKKVEYNSIQDYLLGEGIDKCLPGIPSLDHSFSVYYKWNTQEEIEKYGFIAIKFELI